jgi:hypothetical protein
MDTLAGKVVGSSYKSVVLSNEGDLRPRNKKLSLEEE